MELQLFDKYKKKQKNNKMNFETIENLPIEEEEENEEEDNNNIYFFVH